MATDEGDESGLPMAVWSGEKFRAVSRRAHEAWEARYKHGKAARTWDAIATEHEGTDKRPTTAECRVLAEWMAAYEAADAAAEASFTALGVPKREKMGDG